MHSGEPIAIDADTDAPFSVTFVDAAGRTAWHRDNCRNGERLTPDLPAGPSTVKIENKNINLKSKIIIL